MDGRVLETWKSRARLRYYSDTRAGTQMEDHVLKKQKKTQPATGFENLMNAAFTAKKNR